MTDRAILPNNFDLIRLFAATQVAILHAVYHLQLDAPPLLLKIADLFPGVPIFFFISGLLISRSFENNNSVSRFTWNRFLRLYPGLWVCFVVSLISIQLTGFFRENAPPKIDFALWALAQNTFFQFYNPAFLRTYGCGVLNGSLWTISVELQFYLLVPILYLFIKKHDEKRNLWLLVLIVAFLLINIVFSSYRLNVRDSLFVKIIGVSFIPWFYMFLVGVVVQRNIGRLIFLVEGKPVLWFLLYLLLCCILKIAGSLSFGNSISPLQFFVLCMFVLSLAYTRREFSNKLVRSNDVSYGIYIYHMVFVNFWIQTGLKRDALALVCILACTATFAIASWLRIERRALRLKSFSIRPVHRA
ncbi:acyltransferase family protein [Pirellulaceae bacterium SH449]